MGCGLAKYYGGSNHRGQIVREGCTASSSYQLASSIAGEGTVGSARSMGYSRGCWCSISNGDGRRLFVHKSCCS